MIDSKIDEIINKILYICENSIIYDEYLENHRHVSAKGIEFYVANYNEQYNEILSYFYRENNIDRKYFSKEYIFDIIDILIAETLVLGICIIKNYPKILKSKFKRLFNEKFQEVMVYIPIYGLNLEINEIKIGNVEIKNMDADAVNLLADNLERLLRKNRFFKPENYEEEIDRYRGYVLNFENKTVAIISLRADEKTAIKIAEEETLTVLDVLQFYSYLFYHRDLNAYLGIEGGVARGFNNIIAHKSDFSDYNLTDRLIGAKHLFTISEEELEKMEKFGLIKLSDILKRQLNTLNDFQKKLLIGIHWFSAFRTQNLVENQFISLMVVLEIFLSVRGEPVSNYIAENVARILYSDFEERKKIKIKIKKFYRKRSDIVHGRPEEMPEEKDFDEFECLVFNLTKWMVLNMDKFGSKKELIDYLDDKRLY